MVASFYLPVTLTKRTVPSSGHDADPEDCDGWIADWDHEQLIALQVRDDCCRPFAHDGTAAVLLEA